MRHNPITRWLHRHGVAHVINRVHPGGIIRPGQPRPVLVHVTGRPWTPERVVAWVADQHMRGNGPLRRSAVERFETTVDGTARWRVTYREPRLR